MPKREDETYRNAYPHPPNCTCRECTQRRLKASKNASRTGVCPVCRRKSLFYNSHSGRYECLNLRCKATGRTLSEIRRTRPIYPPRISLPPLQAIKKWTPQRLWWHVPLAIRKLFLNLLVIAAFGLAVWTGYILFTHQTTPVKGTIVFLVVVGFLIWFISVVRSRRYRYTKPSFKLVFWALVGICLVCAFAGVEPLSTIKDEGIAWVGEKWETVTTSFQSPALAPAESTLTPTPPLEPTPTPSPPPAELSLSAVEEETFRLINVERERAGISPTKWDDELYRLSKAHTQEMADRGELFHTPMGASYGENAWGAPWGGISRQNLAQTIVDGWMSSPLHRAWILHAPLKTSVVSIVDDSRGQYASWTFWTGEAGAGPPLVKKAYDIWMSETGGNIPWLDWLYNIKGYPDNTDWLFQ
jgi:uncharacterized protein YkwD